MRELYLKLGGDCLFVRHSAIHADRSTLVFIHGLGESGLSFAEAFDRPELACFNLIVPDLIGFGRSSGATERDYSFKTQADRLGKALDHLGVGKVTLVGHSMGGDLATLMAAWDGIGKVKSLVNVEGNLTPEDLFISSQAAAAADRGQLAEWLYRDFGQVTVLEKWGRKRASCRRYYASLMFCHSEAFSDSARELVDRNRAAAGTKISEIGALFSALSIPKVFCWGVESLAEKTRQLLDSGGAIPHRKFEDASHWVMVDQAGEFYPFLERFCNSEGNQQRDTPGTTDRAKRQARQV